MNRKDFESFLIQNNISYQESTYDNCVFYMHEVLKENNKHNLTAIKSEEDFMNLMVLDSCLCYSNLLKNKKIIDVGTGAGFPGTILKFLDDSLDLTLLDSTKKKTDFIERVNKANSFGLKVVCDRIENYAHKNINLFDVCVARALAPLNILIELTIPLINIGGYLIAFKGPNFNKEIEQASNAFKKLNCHISSIENKKLVNGEERNILYIIKDKETNNKYPRDFSLIRKNPL